MIPGGVAPVVFGFFLNPGANRVEIVKGNADDQGLAVFNDDA